MSPDHIFITVTICTYNRADLLSGAIESLVKQTLSPACFEILVVDNASTDDTVGIVQTYQEQCPDYVIRYLHEVHLGVGHARNAALREAYGSLIAYMDDDARAAPDWLEKGLAIFRTMSSQSRQLICVGGPILPFYTSPRPDWFKDEYEVRTWAVHGRWLEPEEAFSGSNMIWHKESLVAIGGFGEDLGPIGMAFALGEDTLAFKKVWRLFSHAAMFYSPELVVLHWVPEYKMKLSYRLQRAFLNGQSAVQMEEHPSLPWRLRTLARSGGAAFLWTLRALLRKPRYRHWQNWVVEQGQPVLVKIGTVLAVLGVYIPVKRK
jgi:glycosyltransferase involved in cell wall biosynthesis